MKRALGIVVYFLFFLGSVGLVLVASQIIINQFDGVIYSAVLFGLIILFGAILRFSLNNDHKLDIVAIAGFIQFSFGCIGVGGEFEEILLGGPEGDFLAWIWGGVFMLLGAGLLKKWYKTNETHHVVV